MNLNDTQQRIRTTTIVVLVGLTLAFLILDSTGNLDSAFAFLRNPLASVMGWTAERADSAANALAGPRDIQLARLRIQELEGIVAEQEKQIAQYEEQLSEAQIYQQMFNRASDAPQYQRVTAAVIGRDTSPLFRSLIIDRGTEEGVLPGMPVEGPRGLVGQVFRASPHLAQVLLITDNASSIAARLGESRATGMVFGSGTDNTLVMDWIGLEVQVERGDTVVTSGLIGKLPADLLIGEVVEVERSEAEILQRARIQPAEDIDDLEMVFVITSFEPVDTSVFDGVPENLPER